MFKKPQTEPQQSPPPPSPPPLSLPPLPPPPPTATTTTIEKQDSPIYDESNPFYMSLMTTADVHAEPIPLADSSSQSDDKTMSTYVNIENEIWI